jgi:hypothetical protein
MYLEFVTSYCSAFSLKRVQNALPVCPAYFIVQSLHLVDKFRCYQSCLLQVFFFFVLNFFVLCVCFNPLNLKVNPQNTT